MKSLEKCEICGEKNFVFLFEEEDKNLSILGKFKLYQCKNCGLIFLNPQPTYKEFEKYYPKKEYYSLQGIDKNSSKTKLKLFLYSLYFNTENRNYFLKFMFLPIKFMIRGTIIKKNEKILDVGSGAGQFLYEMKKLGLKVYGVEPGEFNEKENEKLNIEKSDLIGAKFKGEFFELITMNHVLEHITNPRETLKEIHRILRRKGIFIVGVPNYNSLAYKMFGKNWYQLDVPRHLSNYSEKILKKLLIEEKFRVVKIRYNSRPSQFVVSMEYLFEKRFGKFMKGFLTIVFLPLTWLVNLLKRGDQMEIWCEKK